VEALDHHHLRHIAGAFIRSWSRSSPPPTPATYARCSPPPRKAAPRSTFCRALSPATSRPTGWASSSSRSCHRLWGQHRRPRYSCPSRPSSPSASSPSASSAWAGHHRRRLVRPVTDNAQSVFELSTIETVPNVKADIKKEFGFDVDFEKARSSWKRTTAPATPSRLRPSRCSSHRSGRRHHAHLLHHPGPHQGPGHRGGQPARVFEACRSSTRSSCSDSSPAAR